jgi:hypothetical protein
MEEILTKRMSLKRRQKTEELLTTNLEKKK